MFLDVCRSNHVFLSDSMFACKTGAHCSGWLGIGLFSGHYCTASGLINQRDAKCGFNHMKSVYDTLAIQFKIRYNHDRVLKQKF